MRAIWQWRCASSSGSFRCVGSRSIATGHAAMHKACQCGDAVADEKLSVFRWLAEVPRGSRAAFGPIATMTAANGLY